MTKLFLAVMHLFQLLRLLVPPLLILDPLILAWRLNGLEDLLPRWAAPFILRLLLHLVRVRFPRLARPGDLVRVHTVSLPQA